MIYNLNELGIRYNPLYEAFIILEKNSTLSFNYKSSKKQLVFLIIQYNSSTKPFLSLKINNKFVNNNLLVHNTHSINKLIGFRTQLGPFEMNDGDNKFEIVCNGTFPFLYHLEVSENPQIINSNFLINDFFKLQMSDFILLETYNTYGGFFWHIHNYFICSYLADKYNKIPIVNFKGTLYLSNTDDFNLIQKNSNWFYNYFNSVLDLPYTTHNTVINFPKRKKLLKSNINEKGDNFVFYFCYETFTDFNLIQNELDLNQKREYIQSKLKLLPYLKNMINKIKNDLIPKKSNQKLIGIHYRGTDKIEEQNLDEEHPIHLEYERIEKILQDKIQELRNWEVKIIVTTDENPLIKFLKKKLGDKIINYNQANRSKIKTSGLSYKFQLTPSRDKIYDKSILDQISRKELVLKEKLINNSIHMGHKNLSNYKKGLDCLIDAYMLSDCDIIFKSKGNFSNYCTFLNVNTKLEVFDLQKI